MKKTWMRGVSGFLTLAMCLSLLTCGASAKNGYSVTVSGKDAVGIGSSVTLTANPEEIGQIGSWGGGGTDASQITGDDYAYDPALYVTADGMQKQLSTVDRIEGGTYNASTANKITIDDSESGHNGILINDTAYTIKNATINMLTDADGTDTCDFSGKGTAVMAVGKNAIVNIENTKITTSGVATMPVFCDAGATVTIKNSILHADGGTLYEEYLNSPDQAVMAAPPWILGIMGTARCTNLEGNDSTMNVIDSETSSANWAVLSTDSGSNMYLNMYNTSLTLTNGKEDSKPMQAEGGELGETLDDPYTEEFGAGYGTYVIGNAVETFAGATVNVGTYACIFTGGTATFTNIEAGKVYTLKSATGENDVTYRALESKNSEVNSETFGFMFHQSANSLTIEKGTVINSNLATFLIKSGSSDESANISVDSSELNNGGVLIQIMDNDDSTTGGMMELDDPDNTNGGNMNFKPYHTENAGWNTEKNTAESEQNVTLTNGDYSGNVYNASGSDNSDYGPLKGTVLNLNLGGDASLTGAVASTAAIHVKYEGTLALAENGFAAFETEEEAAEFVEEYQNTKYWMNQYYDQGQVANLINANGGNGINVTLKGNSVWNVTGTSVIDSLTIGKNCSVNIAEGATLTIGGVAYTAEDLVPGTYGTVAEATPAQGNRPPMGGGDQGGEGEAKSPYKYEWTSSDKTVATVKDNGDGTATVTGVGTGTATITVSMTKNGVDMGEGTVVMRVAESYNDVKDTSVWYYSYVYGVREAGLMNGDAGTNMFRPNSNLTRAEAVKIAVLSNPEIEIEDDATSSFSDVSATHWAVKYIEAAKAAGIVDGYEDGTFRPNANVKREEFVKMLVLAKGYQVDERARSSFSDVPDGWAVQYIESAVSNGLISGYPDGTFGYGNLIKRCEAAAILDRAQ